MFRIKNLVHRNIVLMASVRDIRKKIPIQRETFLKNILLCIYFTNYNEINMNFSDVQKYICCQK